MTVKAGLGSIFVLLPGTQMGIIFILSLFFLFFVGVFFYLNDILNKNIYEKLNVEVSF